MNLLIVDDEKNVLSTTAMTVQTAGHGAFTARNTRQADRILSEEDIHAILLDRMLGNENGLDYLERLNAAGNTRPVIIFTAYSSIESAVESMRKGAFTYIEKPFVPEQIRHMLQILEDKVKTSRKLKELEDAASREQPRMLLESSEPSLARALQTAFKAAASDASILLLGPSGTGKSVLARQIHERSHRAEASFVEISCPSLSRELLQSELFGHVKGSFTGAVKDTWGKVHTAEGGTLFLDEIGELPMELQPKLLRLLQERRYERVGETRSRTANIRVIAATNRNLEEAVKEGSFREDLLYRLKVISILMPPLIERQADLKALAENFLSFFGHTAKRGNLRFSPSAIETIQRFSWPGNLREMRNVIERAVILSDGDLIEPSDLFLEVDGAPSSLRPGQAVSLRRLEEEHIRRVLESAESYEHAAKILEIDTATLYRKRKRLNII